MANNDNWLGASGDYTSNANWSLSAPPGSADTGVFGSLATHQTITIASAPQTADGWSFTGGAYTITVSTEVDFEGAGILLNGGSATIDVANGGTVAFFHNSIGGAARYVIESGGALDFANTGASVMAGSIEGAGEVDLIDNQQLTVGGNNLSTVFSGHIFGGPSTLLVKVGAGALALSAADNTYSGAIRLAAGALDVGAVGAAGTGTITFAAGAQTLKLENSALTAGGFANNIAAFGVGDAIDLAGLTFRPGASADYDAASHVLSITSGGVTDALTLTSPAGAHFAALGDDGGGTRVMLAIIESRPHKLVDATHRPPGQPSPTNGPDVVVALGANDTIKGLGGNDILVGGAAGDVLYGGPGADSFVFEKVQASPPGHPDTIWDFSHAQRDKIDLYDLFHTAHGQSLKFIGAQTFAHYHHLHPTVLGMVRYAGGVVQVDVNGHATPQLAIVMHAAPPLHAGDFIL